MTWDYWTWVGCSVSISVGILLLTLAVLLILKVESDTIFYGIVTQLLDIERCFIDVHHKIIRKDEKVNFNDVLGSKFSNSLNPSFIGIVKDPAGTMRTIAGLVVLPNEQSITQNSEEDQNIAPRSPDGAAENDDGDASKKSAKTKQEILPESESHPEHEREILNVYGKYISVHKKGTFVCVMILTTIIISGALIAAFNTLFLATTSVYRDGPCPSIGLMECFCGGNHTYFSCNTGQTASCPLDAHSSACFRWTGRDISTSDVTTQLGVTTGLLLAFGNIAKAIIRIYMLAFNKRLNIATGIYRMAAKTIGINRDTAPTKCCCCKLCWHCSACNLSLFKHPAAVIVATGIYIAIPILMIPLVILLYYYEISVTSLTFVVLVVFGMLCVLSIVWIMVQESEASSNIPGGWTEVKNLLRGATTNAKAIATGKVSANNEPTATRT